MDNRVNQFIMDFFNRHMNASSDGTAFKTFVKDNIKNVGITMNYLFIYYLLFNYSFNLCGGLLNQIQWLEFIGFIGWITPPFLANIILFTN